MIDSEGGERVMDAEAIEARQSGTVFFVRPRSLTDDRQSDDAPFENNSNGYSVFRDVVMHIWDKRRRLLMQLVLASSLSGGRR